jgi:hypothetical protein
MSESNDIQRALLPIPDRPYAGPVMYDARDPDADYAAIAPVTPPDGHMIDPADVVHLALGRQ